MGNSTIKTVALIPLRGGSKSIPLKNIKPIAGKPLCLWVLQAAIESNVFGAVVVSTDDDRIADVIRVHLPSVKILRRSAELSTDVATTESVMMHASQQLAFDILCTIQATSPLTTADDFRAAYKVFVESKADSLLSAVRLKRFFWTEDGRPINYNPLHRPMRQRFRGILMENGAFYFTRRELLEKTGCRLGGSIRIYEMNEETAFELDEPEDWPIVEKHLLRRRERHSFRRIVRLRYFFFDVDGTLTDAAMYYSSKGEYLKRFNTRDGFGIQSLREEGIEVGLMSSEDSPIVSTRASKLKLRYAYSGVANKEEQLKRFSEENGIGLSEIGFMGDDLNDLPAIMICGFSACPSDAMEEVKQRVDYVCTLAGGQGAVRELCDWLIIMRSRGRSS
jgi:YrbI family 3-deoxy-D-manno-octulosonate 8-phosphate phosphatase